MIRKRVALVTGDGSGPEMMAAACPIVVEAARSDGVYLEFVKTPMGWNAYDSYGDTLPQESLEAADEIGVMYFGGVGLKQRDKTEGRQLKVLPNGKPAGLSPEPRVLLYLRNLWGLLLNHRPVIYDPRFKHLAQVNPRNIPDRTIVQYWIRFLLQDGYFGNTDLWDMVPELVRQRLGIKLSKDQVSLEDTLVTDLSYYRKETLFTYFRAAFEEARRLDLPVWCVDKSNVLPRYVLWRLVFAEVAREYKEQVQHDFLIVDAANSLHFWPAKLHGVLVGGNEHFDLLSDAAIAANGSLGMMYSSAVNPTTGQAMFESGAGTYPEVMGQDRANPIGRIKAGALMLQHIGCAKGAAAINKAVEKVLLDGYRTIELFQEGVDDPKKRVGTRGMGEAILARL